jgi:hypothetical protein
MTLMVSPRSVAPACETIKPGPPRLHTNRFGVRAVLNRRETVSALFGRFLPRLARLPNGGRAFLFVPSTAHRFENASGLFRLRPCFPVGIAKANRKGGEAFAESLAGVFAIDLR